MPVPLCLTCGAPATPTTTACPECGGFDAGTVDTPPPADPHDRLLERVADALRAKSALEADDPACAAVRARLTGQATLLHARLAGPAIRTSDRQRAFLEYALARVEVALADLD